MQCFALIVNFFFLRCAFRSFPQANTTVEIVVVFSEGANYNPG